RQLEHTAIARGVREERAAILVGVLLRRRRELVDEPLHGERIEGVVHRAPEPDRDARVGELIVDMHVGDGVPQSAAALDRFPIQTVLDGLRKHPSHYGWRDDAM